MGSIERKRHFMSRLIPHPTNIFERGIRFCWEPIVEADGFLAKASAATTEPIEQPLQLGTASNDNIAIAHNMITCLDKMWEIQRLITRSIPVLHTGFTAKARECWRFGGHFRDGVIVFAPHFAAFVASPGLLIPPQLQLVGGVFTLVDGFPP
jgi:hypothetical protein